MPIVGSSGVDPGAEDLGGGFSPVSATARREKGGLREDWRIWERLSEGREDRGTRWTSGMVPTK